MTATRLKLVGQQVDLLPRKHPAVSANHPGTLDSHNSELGTPALAARHNVPNPAESPTVMPPEIAIPQAAAGMSLACQQQAQFLARIAAAKIKRGETDKVFLGKGRRLESVVWTGSEVGSDQALEQVRDGQHNAETAAEGQERSGLSALTTSTNIDPTLVSSSAPVPDARPGASSPTTTIPTISTFPQGMIGKTSNTGRSARRGRPRGQFPRHHGGKITGLGGLFRDYNPIAGSSEQDFDATDTVESGSAGLTTALEENSEISRLQERGFGSTPTSWGSLAGFHRGIGAGVETKEVQSTVIEGGAVGEDEATVESAESAGTGRSEVGNANLT